MGLLLVVLSCLIAIWGTVKSAPALATPPTTAIRYVYDADEQLKAVINPASETALYTWDPVGNLTSIALKASTKLSLIQLAPSRASVGDTVTILGTGFSTTTTSDTVKFNGTAATVSAATAVSLTVKVPTGATTGTVSVQTPTEGPVVSAQTFTVASSPAPGITSLSTSVASSGGSVTISGKNFEAAAFNDVVAVNQSKAYVSSASSTSLQFTVPPATGGGKVSVSTPWGSTVGSNLFIPPNGIPTSKIGTTGTVALGSATTVKLTTAEKDGLEIFEGTAGQHVSLVLSEDSVNGQLSVWGPEGALVAGYNTFSNGFTTIVEPFELPATGSYTVLLEPETTHTGNLKLTAYSVVNVTGSISPTAEGESKSVAITTPTQNALYTLSATAGEEVSTQVSEFAFGGGEVELEWLNAGGGVVASQGFGSNGFMGSVAFPTAGTYTLVVNPFKLATGSLKLTTYNATAITGSITPTIGGESKTVTTTVPGQKAKFTFSGTSGQEVSLVFAEITIASGWTGVHYPEGGQTEKSFSAGGESTMGPITLPSTGTYTITIEPTGSATGSIKTTAYLGSPPKGMAVHKVSGRAATAIRQDAVAPSDGFLQRTAALAQGLPRSSRVDHHSRLKSLRSRATSLSKGRLGRRHHAAGAHRARRMPQHPEASSSTARGGRDLIPPAARAFRPDRANQWRPPASSHDRMAWETNEPPSPWAQIASLQAAEGTTALSGRILAQNGLPLAGVKVAIEGTYLSAKTDDAGRFLLEGEKLAGHQVLVVEGETVAGKQRYGIYEVGVDLVAHKTTVLDYTIWLTPLERAGNHHLDVPTQQETRLTTSQIPGLEVRIPAGTVVTDPVGRAIHKLNITAIPIDRPPFPLPALVNTPLYFTIQPGRAYLSKGAQIVYPNWSHQPPGQRVDFWNYDPDKARGWYIYGKGTVTPDGKQIMPDPDVRVWEFTGAMTETSPSPPTTAPPPGATATGSSGDPVDLQSGLFDYHKTDLVLPDTLPITIEHTYRQSDSNSYSFGIGTESMYDMRLWSNNLYHEVDLVLPNGGRVVYMRTSPGEGWAEAEFRSTNSPGLYYGSTVKWNSAEAGWDLTLTNGLTYMFGETAPLDEIRDRFGNKLTITREHGRTGNMTQITSPHGRWAAFKYDGSNRLTEITTSAGDAAKYSYNAAGLLEKVTDPAGRTTSYEYNTAKEMTSIKDGRGKVYVENEYDTHERVAKQTLGDGGIYNFAYTIGGSEKVEATTVTDPRKIERKVTFNTQGFPVSDIHALGTSIQQTTTYEPQAGTGLLLSMTDPRGRKTSYQYDESGNTTKRTLLAGTGSPQVTEYSYEPGTTELASVIDSLKHTTTYHYGAHGELLSETDPLGHTVTFEYNSSGQTVAITNALGKTTKFTYTFGDLTAVTDPLSRTRKRFIDGRGQIASTTTPTNQRTIYEYNPDSQPTKVTDPLGAVASYEYDGDGDLTTTTDPNTHKTTATYDAMDRFENETDALEHTTKLVSDVDGNVVEYTDRRGKLTKLSYDSLNRLTEEKCGVSGESSESSVKYEYDNGNRVTKVTDSATGTYTPEYDELNRITSLATPTGTVSYSYDEANRRKTMTAPGQEALKYTYDEANRLKELARGTQKVAFTYDEGDRLTKTTLVDGVEEKYVYDNANEPTAIAYKKGATTLGELNYSYDTNAGREAVWGSYARTGMPEAVSSAVYNADNEQTERGTKKLSYDANGNLTSDGTNEYKWNARNQLTTITGGVTASFEYDPFGRRASKTLGGTTTKLLYDGANAVQETKGAATANLLTGLRVDSTFARTTSSATENVLSDALRSTIALAGSTGTVATTYAYDPFGNTTKEGTGSENPFQYAGRENDGDGLYYNRARYLSPAGGRFISQDPLGAEANGPNLYGYSGNAPTNATDPFGTTSGESMTEEEYIQKAREEEAGLVTMCEHHGENPPLTGPLPPGIGLTHPYGPGGPGGDGGSQGPEPPETMETPGGPNPRCEGKVGKHF